MKVAEMHVVFDLNAESVNKGFSKQDIADGMHKDVSVVKKQLTERNGNIQLLTVYEYAEYLGGTICFLSDQQAADLAMVDEYKRRIAELEQRLDTRNKEHAIQSEQITHLTETVNHLSSIREDQYASIKRKDKAISVLLSKMGVLE